MREFHAALPQLLSKPNGVYSFFNGMCPNNLFFQGVACEVVRLGLENLGLQCEFHGMVRFLVIGSFS
jgi:protein arginine N-methyltransferase 2